MTIPVEYVKNEGLMYYRGSRSEMLGNGFFSSLQKEMEEITGPAVRQILYNSAKKSTYQQVTRYKKRFFNQKKLQNPSKQAEFLLEEIPGRGLGKVISYEIDKELPQLTVKIKNSFNAQGYDKTTHPVCFTMSGFLAGAAEGLFGKSVDCKEIKCKAMGDPSCEFVVSPVKTRSAPKK